jgi:hypothetical protein
LGAYVCEESSEQITQNTPVQVAASPDHLVVLQDLQGFTTQLPNGNQCATQYFIRQINFQVVSHDSNGAAPVGNVPVEERFASQPVLVLVRKRLGCCLFDGTLNLIYHRLAVLSTFKRGITLQCFSFDSQARLLAKVADHSFAIEYGRIGS